MNWKEGLRQTGVPAALGADVLQFDGQLVELGADVLGPDVRE